MHREPSAYSDIPGAFPALFIAETIANMTQLKTRKVAPIPPKSTKSVAHSTFASPKAATAGSFIPSPG